MRAVDGGLGRYSAAVSEQKWTGKNLSKKRRFILKEPRESHEPSFPSGAEVFVRIDGREYRVETRDDSGFRPHSRAGQSIAGSGFKTSKNLKAQAITAPMYIGTSDAVEALKAITAYTTLMRELGFIRVDVVEVQDGSVWVRFKQGYKRFIDNRRVRVAAVQIVNGVEAGTVEKYQAENTAALMNATANVVESIKHLKSFSFDSGPLQFAQYMDENGDMHARARVINSKDIASNRLDEAIVRDPKRMLEQLTRDSDSIGPAE